MTEQSNAELVAVARSLIDQYDPAFAFVLKQVTDRLEAADQRAAELAAVVEKVREICAEASGAEERNVATSRALGYASLLMREHVPSLVEVREVLATAPADALAERDAALIEGLADEWSADPDAWGDNEKDYRNTLREKARQRREERS